MSKRRVLILANPRAGDGFSQRLLAQANVIDGDLQPEIVPLGDSQDLPRRLGDSSEGAVAGVVVFGGDGTVSRLLPLLLEVDLPVAVFPAGTVNDLALELGMSADWGALARLLDEGSTSELRPIEVNGLPFAVYGTLGLGAEASRRLQHMRTRMKGFRQTFPRLQTPLFTAYTALFTQGYVKPLRLTLDGRAFETRSAGIYVANQARLNRKIDLEWDRAAARDRFRVLVFKPMGRWQLLRTVFRLASSGRLSAVRDRVDVYDVAEARIESLDGSGLAFIADGEPLLEAPHLHFALGSKPLRVVRGSPR